MSGTVKGLTVEIGGEVTKLTKAMNEASKEARSTQTELNKVDKLLSQIDGDSMALAAQKTTLLNKSVETTSQRLRELEAMQSQIAAQVGPMTEAQIADYRALEREIEFVRQKLIEARTAQLAFTSGSTAALALGASMTKLGQDIDSVVSKLKYAAIGVAAIGRSAVNASIEFESSFAGVRKTVDATEQEYAALAKAAREVALNKPVEVYDINLMMELGGQLGIAKDNLVSFANVVGDLNVSTDLGVEDAASDLARFANITGMAQQDFDRFGSTIVALGNNTASTESEIAEFAMRLSGAAASANFSQASILGISAAMASVGLNAEAGGSAMSKLIQEIDKDVALGNEGLKLWAETAGMTAEEFTNAWKNDPPQALNAFIAGLTRVKDEGGSLAVKLDELGITELRQTDTVKRLANAHDLMSNTISLANVAWNENAALAKEASQRYATTESQLQILKNRIIDAAISLGDQLKPVILDVGSGLVDFASGALSVAGSIAEATKDFSGLGIALTAVFALSGKITSALGGIGTFVGNLGMTFARTTAQIEAGTYATVVNEAKTATLTATTGAAAVIKNLSAAAEAKLTAATVANTTATTASTVATTALSGAQKLATMAQIAFNAAFKANPIGMVLTLVVAAIAAFKGLADVIGDTVNGENTLTEATKEHQRAVSEAQAAYDEAVRVHGEMSEEAGKAKAALEDEQAAFEASKQTIAELKEEADSLIESHNSLMDSIRSTNSAANVEGGTILNLVDKFQALVTLENKSAEDKTRLSALVDQLNASCKGLNLTYDAQNDSLNMTADAVEKIARAEAHRLKADAAMEHYNSLISEQTELEMEQSKITSEIIAKSEHLISINPFETIINGIQGIDLNGKLEDINRALDENKRAQENALEVYTQTTMRQEALSKASEAVANGYMSAQLAAYVYSDGLKDVLTQEEVNAQASLLMAEKLEEEAENFAELQAKVQELCLTTPGLQTAISEAGMTIDDFAQTLADAGISTDDFEESIKSLVEVTTDGFSELKQATDISLDEYIANLQQRQVATLNWSSNIQQLYAEAGNGAERQFIDYLRQLGPEYSDFVQQIIDQNRLPEVAAQWADGGKDAGTAYTGNLTASMYAGMPSVDESVDDIVGIMEDSVSPASHAGSDAGSGYGQNMAQGMSGQVGNVQNSAAQLANATEAANANSSNAWYWGNDLGQNIANGLSAAIGTIQNVASWVAGSIASFLHFSVPDEGPLSDADEYMSDFIDLMVSDLEKSAPKLVRSVAALATKTSDAMKLGYTLDDASLWQNRTAYSQYGSQRNDIQNLSEAIESLSDHDFGITINIENFSANNRSDIDYFSEQLATRINRGRASLYANE